MDVSFVPGPAQVPLPRELLEEEDGFALWHADLLDDHGNGVLFTWGFGAPEARAGRKGAAAEHPSLSLLIFSGGRPMVWLQQRYPAEDASWDEPMGRWRFGRTQIEALRDVGSQVVIVRLDCPLPGTRQRLQGTFEVAGPPRRSTSAEEGDEPWAPLVGPGKARAAIRVGDAPFTLLGRGHHGRHGRRGAGAVRSASGQVFLDGALACFELRAHPGGLVLSGALVEEDGRTQAPAALRAEGDVTAFLDGEEGELVLRDGDAPWLKLVGRGAVHARPAGRHLLVQGRVPMKLPGRGAVRVLDEGRVASTLVEARPFLHDLRGKNAWTSRAHVGLQRRQWSRLLRP